MWLTNHLQLQLEATCHLIPESQTLTGWINGDLYIPAGERIGILPVPDSIRAAADIESYHAEDGKFKHAYLAQEQGTKYLNPYHCRKGPLQEVDAAESIVQSNKYCTRLETRCKSMES